MTRSRKGKGTTGIKDGDRVFWPSSPDVLGTVNAVTSHFCFVVWDHRRRPDQWHITTTLEKVKPTQPPKPADPEITSYYEAITEGS